MAKKEKSPYGPDGRWVEERARIKGAIRRVFRLSPQMKEVLQAARVELPPALKKNGTPGKKNQVRFRCAICSGLFSQKHVQVDHIEPVVPLHKTEQQMTIDEIAFRIICDKSNLQVVCSTPLKLNDGNPSCHRIKTNEENFIRDYLSKQENLNELDDKIKRAMLEFKKHLEEKEVKRIEKEKRKKIRTGKRRV